MERGKITVTWSRGTETIMTHEWHGYDLLRATRLMVRDLMGITRNWHDSVHSTGETRNGEQQKS